MKKPFRTWVGILISVGILNACIEPYDDPFNFNDKVLVVDGFITNQSEADTILIVLLDSHKEFTDQFPVQGAMVSIVTQNGPTVQLKEATGGKYYTPAGFRGEVGKSYQLRFTLSGNREYESNFQTLTSVPDVLKVYNVFDPKGILDNTGTKTTPANLVYIDTQDPANERNFYLWHYTHFEQQLICASCDQGIYMKPTESCFKIRASPSYDYPCESACWEIIYSSQINTFSDVNSDGRLISGRLIAKLPLYSLSSGCLIEIQQYSVSAETYRFYKILESQTQTSGGLTDTPPAPIAGNVRSVNNSEENVAGFFGASGVTKLRYFIDRKNAYGPAVQLLGRLPIYEPTSPLRPPLAKCFASSTRTPIKPQGWPN